MADVASTFWKALQRAHRRFCWSQAKDLPKRNRKQEVQRKILIFQVVLMSLLSDQIRKKSWNDLSSLGLFWEFTLRLACALRWAPSRT